MCCSIAKGKVIENAKVVKQADGRARIFVALADGVVDSPAVERLAGGEIAHIYEIPFPGGSPRAACEVARKLRAGKRAEIRYVDVSCSLMHDAGVVQPPHYSVVAGKRAYCVFRLGMPGGVSVSG